MVRHISFVDSPLNLRKNKAQIQVALDEAQTKCRTNLLTYEHITERASHYWKTVVHTYFLPLESATLHVSSLSQEEAKEYENRSTLPPHTMATLKYTDHEWTVIDIQRTDSGYATESLNVQRINPIDLGNSYQRFLAEQNVIVYPGTDVPLQKDLLLERLANESRANEARAKTEQMQNA